MTEDGFDAKPRPLPWPLRDAAEIYAETPAGEIPAGVFTWPEDSDERVTVTFELSLNEFVALASAIDVGTDIAYSTDATKIWWIWIRSFNAVPICAAIIECLTTDSDVQEALATLIATNPAIGDALSEFMRTHPTGIENPKQQPLPTGVVTGSIFSGNPDCNPDILWQQCVGTVQTCNRMIVDFLETWETYNNAGETGNAILGAIPLLGDLVDLLGIDDIIEYANQIVDAIRENYDADYTLEYEDALACEIFCAAKSSCAVSIDDVCNILNTRIGNQLNLDNVLEMMTSLIDADISGFNVADLYFAAFWNALKLGNLLLPITWGVEQLLSLVRVYNTPSDDWIILCTDCPDVPILQIYGDGAQGLNNPTEFLRYDENGYEVWQITMDAVVFAPQPVMNCADRLGRCFFIRTWDTAMHEFSGYECDGTYVPSTPSPDLSLSYTVIAGIADLGTLTITVHLERDF